MLGGSGTEAASDAIPKPFTVTKLVPVVGLAVKVRVPVALETVLRFSRAFVPKEMLGSVRLAKGPPETAPAKSVPVPPWKV